MLKTRVRRKAKQVKQRGGNNGLVLVFDLDETIINTSKPIQFNQAILDLLNVITPLRGQEIDAVFLLTNNSREEYIKLINNLLAKITHYNAVNYFDYVMTYKHPTRDEGRTKSLKNVEFMMDTTGKSKENLLSRTFFFDDQEHVIQEEMIEGGVPDHYIQIIPGFTGNGDEDETNYEPVYSAIRNQSGGKRKNSRTRKVRRSN